MSRRTSPEGTELGSPTVVERLAPRPPERLVADRIERHTAPGDIVLDLHGRGGWVARSALALGRQAVSLEESPLTRLLAELVLRPPDPHHLDAAFEGLAIVPVDGIDLPAAIGGLFVTTCPSCDSRVVADAFTWIAVTETGGQERPAEPATHLVGKDLRCAGCSDPAEPEDGPRRWPSDADDARRAAEPADTAGIRASLRARFPVPDGAEPLVEDVLDLHSPRQLTGLMDRGRHRG